MMKYRAMIMNSIGTLTVCFILLYTASCTTPKPYIIGFLGGFSGGLSDLSIAGRNGVILATEEVNRTGGIAGRTVELVIRDDKDDPEAAQQSITFFEEKSVVGIVGPMTSEMSRAAAPVAHKEKIVMISPTANSADFPGPGAFFFRVSPSDRDEAHHLAELAFQQRGYDRISILYDLSNREYAENRVHYFRNFLEDFGGTIAQVTSYTTRDDTDYGLLVTQVSQNNPDAVYILTGGSDLSRICRELKKQGSTLPVLADGWAVSPEVIGQSGSAAEGIEFFQSYDLNSTAAPYQDFLLNYRARFHEEPELGAFYAYESAIILLSALEQAGSKRNLNDIIHQIKLFKGLQDTLEINQDGVAQRPLYHKRIENGAIVLIAAD